MEVCGCGIKEEPPLLLERPFHVLVWKDNQAMFCNEEGKNFRPVEWTHYITLHDNLKGYYKFGERKMTARDNCRKTFVFDVDNVWYSFAINSFNPWISTICANRYHNIHYHWENNNTVLLFKSVKGQHRIVIPNGEFIDILFTKEDLDVFDQIMCIYLQSTFLLKDICKLIGEFI